MHIEPIVKLIALSCVTVSRFLHFFCKK